MFRLGFGEGERDGRLSEEGEPLRVRRALGVTGVAPSTPFPLVNSLALMDMGEPNPLALDALNMLDAGERSRLEEGERRLEVGRLSGEGERTAGVCGCGEGKGEGSFGKGSLGISVPTILKEEDRMTGEGAFS